MHNILLLLALFISPLVRLGAQGICDSTISIAPIQPLCQGTGVAYLQVSHPGGVFSGPGLINNTSYLNAEGLGAGFYTAKYTITGPGGCTVQTTRQFEVRDAEEAFASAFGQIDCSNPGSTVMLQANLPNPQNYSTGNWIGPAGSGFNLYNNFGTTSFAGTYKFMAYPTNFNNCPAYSSVNVGFTNNQTQIQITDCTNCAESYVRIKVDPVPLGWQATLKAPNGANVSNGGLCTAVSHFFPSGVWTAEAVNSQNGCKSTTSTYLDTDYASPSVSAGSSIQLWCGGTAHLLPAMAPSSGIGFNYFWTRPDGSTASAAYAALFPVTEPGTYVLHGVNNFTGCESTDTTFVAAPITPVSTQIAVICDGETLNGHTEAGTYIDTIPLAFGCIKIEYTKLFILAPLLDSIEVSADNGLMNGSIHYMVTQGWPPFSYQWSTGEITPSIDNLSGGDYSVTVTDANNCEHVRAMTVPSGKPIQNLVSDRTGPISIQARLYPNPAAAGLVKCTMEVMASREAGDATLMVNDVLGRTISTQTFHLDEGKNILSWPETLSEGVYSLFLKGSFGVSEVSKLVVR